VELSAFPRPNVAVDLAVLSVRPTARGAELVALVQQRFERPRGDVLPGRFIREGETIKDTVAAILRDKLDVAVTAQSKPRLLRVFDEPGRDERGWTISIGHSLALPWYAAASAHGDWRPVTSRGAARGTKLLFDHPTILSEAVTAMRTRYEIDPDPDRLLVGEFTLLDLRTLHEAVLGAALRKDTFNRRMREHLSETGASSTVLSLSPSSDMVHGDSLVASSPSLRRGRPARLYRHPRRSPNKDRIWSLPREDS
jgi:ADP-ribose pyrophosphatase YjhB (NUDIX family)